MLLGGIAHIEHRGPGREARPEILDDRDLKRVMLAGGEVDRRAVG